MNSFITDTQVRAIIVSYKVSKQMKEFLKQKGIKVISTCRSPNLPEFIDDHPDLQIHPISFNKFLVDKDLFNYYKRVLSEFDIELIKSLNSIGPKYPLDSLLNVARISNYYIHNDIIDERLKMELDQLFLHHIFVKQGYSKCSTLNINYDTIITQDMGIHKKILSLGLNSHLISPGSIKLDGYSTGFIGGCGGMISKDQLLLSGDPSEYRYLDELKDILSIYNISIIYPDLEFRDVGSIIPIKGVI